MSAAAAPPAPANDDDTTSGVIQFEYTRCLKCHDPNFDSELVDEREETIVRKELSSGQECLNVMLLPVLRAFSALSVPLFKISIKAVGPFPHTQWISELDLDFNAARVQFRIATPIVPASFALIYELLERHSPQQLKFLHLRYCILDEQDEAILSSIVRQNDLSVLFLGVVTMRGQELMQALQQSTSVETLALIWLKMEDADDFPVVDFLSRLHQFTSIQNLVLLPFISSPALWAALGEGLSQSQSIKDVMISGEGGCLMNDSIVSNLVNQMNREVVKRLRLNNVCLAIPGMKSLCHFLSSSQVHHLDLSGSILTYEAVQLLSERLPQLTNLRSIDFADAQAPNRLPFPRHFTKTLLDGISKHTQLVDIILSYTAMSIDLKQHRDFYVQRNRSTKMMVEPDKVFPKVLELVSQRGWTSLLYHFIRERPDVTFGANSDGQSCHDKKRKAIDNASCEQVEPSTETTAKKRKAASKP